MNIDSEALGIAVELVNALRDIATSLRHIEDELKAFNAAAIVTPKDGAPYVSLYAVTRQD